MNLSAPTKPIFFGSFLLMALGLIGKLFFVPVLSTYAFILVLAAAVIMLLASVLRGL